MFTVPQPTLAVTGKHQRFPVRRVYGVGRTYAEHACGMGTDPDREPPFHLTKPAAAFATDGFDRGAPYPPHTHNLHHEIELGDAIGTADAVDPDHGRIWLTVDDQPRHASGIGV